MGRSGRHRQTDAPKTLRITLIAAGLAAVALAAIVVSVTAPRSSSADPALADVSRPLEHTGRGDPRTPLATPTPEPTETPPEQPRKKRHRKVLSHGACEASYYGSGGRTASGQSFDAGALTAAHRTLPIGSKVRVTNRHNDRSVVVRINDRGPFVPGRCLDLSSAAMHAVGGLGSGVIPVRYEVLAQI